MDNLREKTDWELVNQFCRLHDKSSFGEIYRRYIKDTYRFIYSRVGDKQGSEDIVSETFFTLIEVLSNFNNTSKLKTFIFGIASNKIKQYFDKISENPSVELNEEIIFLEVSETKNSRCKKTDDIIKKILEELPEKYRNVLMARFLYSKNIKQTAKDLNLSESNVRVIQNRALAKAYKIAKKLKLYEK